MKRNFKKLPPPPLPWPAKIVSETTRTPFTIPKLVVCLCYFHSENRRFFSRDSLNSPPPPTTFRPEYFSSGSRTVLMGGGTCLYGEVHRGSEYPPKGRGVKGRSPINFCNIDSCKIVSFERIF